MPWEVSLMDFQSRRGNADVGFSQRQKFHQVFGVNIAVTIDIFLEITDLE
jgi:hypothetical protein